jgi:hypothetical protein
MTSNLPHHLHLISAEPHQGVFGRKGTKYTFKPFTGHEPEPSFITMVPDQVSATLTPEQTIELLSEYRAAHQVWAKAKFRLDATPLLRAMAPLWGAYAQARRQWDAAMTALENTNDSQWRAGLLKLHDARQKTLVAARAFDGHAAKLALLEEALPFDV